uniref:sister chromatid cohesion protein PDS5 homolog B-B-like n=1 Tax=Erigeron canadensis TaxID=72917 RepID=UPI001CB9923B|nr:sister chromatid cohesion protein PDS5 homolog B-B-like [Erigeron canadensis]
MAASGSQLSKSQIQIMKTSIMLLNLPSSNAQIVDVLEQMEQILSGVKQSPSKSMLQVLDPISKALIAQELVIHPDMNVNISVACCICEIMRIMAPEYPYSNKQMKHFFEMVVSTFEKLSSASGGCYKKMAKVLKIFRKYRLCVLILDIDLDGCELIVRLFKHFLTFADSNSSAIVYEMEKIMTMIIEESKELKHELQCNVVASVKRNNQITSHVCWQLGEKVLMNCAAQLKPDLPEMGRDMSIALYDYSKMVVHICKTASENYNTVANKMIPYTTEILNLGKDTTNRRKLECIKTVRHFQQGPEDSKKDEKITLSFDDPSMPSKSGTELKVQNAREIILRGRKI